MLAELFYHYKIIYTERTTLQILLYRPQEPSPFPHCTHLELRAAPSIDVFKKDC